MKNVKDKLNNIISNKNFCAICLIVAILLSIYPFIRGSLISLTLSEIGRQNISWFLVWGIWNAFAVFINLRFLYIHYGLVKMRYQVISLIGCLTVIITVTMLGEDNFSHSMHWVSAILFTLVSFSSVLAVYIYNAYKKIKQYYIFTTVLCIAAVIDVLFLIFFGFTALCEIFILLVTLTLLFCSNFFVNYLTENNSKYQKEKKVK